MNKTTYFLTFFLSLLILVWAHPIDGQSKTRRKKTGGSKIQKTKISAEEKKILDELDKELEENKPDKIYVFVGEKIEVKPFNPKLDKGEILMDSAFQAKYKIVHNIYGNYDKEMIEFEVYDHYGEPSFSKYRHVLLFVSEYNGKLYHEKYQYFDVNKTKDGKWASCGDPYRFDDYHRKPFKSISLEFDAPVYFETGNLKPIQIKEIYPKPFFAIEGNRARCLMGAYVEDLFIVKKNGVLKARGIFR